MEGPPQSSSAAPRLHIKGNLDGLPAAGYDGGVFQDANLLRLRRLSDHYAALDRLFRELFDALVATRNSAVPG